MATPSTPPVRVTLTALARRLYGPQGPLRATAGSAGVDLRACLEHDATIAPGGRAAIPCGLAIQPASQDVAGFLFSRSGLGARDGLVVAQGVGLVDSDYRGEIVVYLLNTSGESRTVSPGDRIAQLVFLPVQLPAFEVVEALDETPRGAGGFGHTGAR